MGIKKYILLALVYILAIGLYVYSFNGDSYTLSIYKFSLNLPIALWIILPVAVLFIFSIFHMLFYSFKEFLNARALKKDFASFKMAFGKKILGEDLSVGYKTENFKFIGKSLKTMSFNEIPDDLEFNDDTVRKYSNILDDINEGKVVELKKYKLSLDNPLVIKTRLNKLEIDPKYASIILKECKDENSEICQKAYFKYIKYASFDEIMKINFAPTKESFRVLMERYLDEEEKFDIPLSSIEGLLLQFKATREDYLELAYEIKAKLSPDVLIALFEKLYNSHEHPEAADAYLYVLYELQMIEKIREILDNSDEKDFIKFKTLLFLRDHGKNVNSGLFLRE